MRLFFKIILIGCCCMMVCGDEPSAATKPIDAADVEAAMERMRAKQKDRDASELERLRRENVDLKAEIEKLRSQLESHGTKDIRPELDNAQNRRDVQLTVSGGRFLIRQRSEVIYLPATGDSLQDSWLITWEFRNAAGETVHDVEGFYDIGGKPQQMMVTTDNNFVAKARFGGYTFIREGKATVTLSIGGKGIRLSFNVRRVPVRIGDSSEVAIKALGMPAKNQYVSATWPDSKMLDGEVYSPEADEYIDAAQHWRYQDWPELVVVIKSGAVHKIITCPEGSLKF